MWSFLRISWSGVGGGGGVEEGRGGLSVEARQILFRIPAEVTYFVVLIDKQGVQPNNAPAFRGRRAASAPLGEPGALDSKCHHSRGIGIGIGIGGMERRISASLPVKVLYTYRTEPCPPLFYWQQQQLHKFK